MKPATYTNHDTLPITSPVLLSIDPDRHLRDAHVLLNQGDYFGAAKKGEIVLTSLRYSTHDIIMRPTDQMRGVIAVHHQKWVSAALELIGKNELQSGHHIKGVDILQRASVLDPDNVDILSALADACKNSSLEMITRALKQEERLFDPNPAQVGEIVASDLRIGTRAADKLIVLLGSQEVPCLAPATGIQELPSAQALLTRACCAFSQANLAKAQDDHTGRESRALLECERFVLAVFSGQGKPTSTADLTKETVRLRSQPNFNAKAGRIYTEALMLLNKAMMRLSGPYRADPILELSHFFDEYSEANLPVTEKSFSNINFNALLNPESLSHIAIPRMVKDALLLLGIDKSDLQEALGIVLRQRLTILDYLTDKDADKSKIALYAFVAFANDTQTIAKYRDAAKQPKGFAETMLLADILFQIAQNKFVEIPAEAETTSQKYWALVNQMAPTFQDLFKNAPGFFRLI